MRILGKILYGIFIAALVAVAGIFISTLLPIPGNIEVKIVKSGSMEPTIATGPLVIVKPADAYAVGEVITFGEDSRNQIPTTHRIVSVREESGTVFYTTKGDANEEADVQEVAASNVIGKVLFDAPYAGYILDFARQPIGFTLLIGVPAGIIILDESARIIQEVAALRRKRKEKLVHGV